MAEYNIKELLQSFSALKMFYGEDLVSVILAVDPLNMRKWTRKTRPVNPSEIQKRYIAALLDVYEVLSVLPRQEQKMWWVSFSQYYLYGIPAEEFVRRPNDVRLAAMMKVSGQEDSDFMT